MIKYKKPQYLPPGAGSFDEVTFEKVLPKSNKGNVQVPMLYFLTAPGVSPLSQAFVTAMIWCPKNSQQKLVWYRSGAGKDVPSRQDSPGFSVLSFCNRNAISTVLATIAIYKCAKCCTRGKGVRNFCKKSPVSLFSVPMLGHIIFTFSTPASWAGNKVKNLRSIVLLPLSFRKAVRS